MKIKNKIGKEKLFRNIMIASLTLYCVLLVVNYILGYAGIFSAYGRLISENVRLSPEEEYAIFFLKIENVLRYVLILSTFCYLFLIVLISEKVHSLIKRFSINTKAILVFVLLFAIILLGVLIVFEFLITLGVIWALSLVVVAAVFGLAYIYNSDNKYNNHKHLK